jgi:hypothetical protein
MAHSKISNKTILNEYPFAQESNQLTIYASRQTVSFTTGSFVKKRKTPIFA